MNKTIHGYIFCVSQIKLMTDKYEELINAEGLSGGLVIDKALFGVFDDEQFM